MAEDGAPGTSRAEGSGDVSLRELSELRDLLFGGERRQLDELRRRLDTYEVTPEELAEKLPQAIVERGSKWWNWGGTWLSAEATAAARSIMRSLI